MRKKFGWVLVTVCTAMSLVAFVQGAPEAIVESNQATKSLDGAWFVNVRPTLIPAFVSIGTYEADGTLTNISSVSLSSPPESPGYGVWVKTGQHKFAVTFMTITTDGAGNFTGTQKVRATLTISPNGDETSGVFQVDVFDPAGNLIVSDTGTVRGTRIKVEPL